jgi:hypothetical protein
MGSFPTVMQKKKMKNADLSISTAKKLGTIHLNCLPNVTQKQRRGLQTSKMMTIKKREVCLEIDRFAIILAIDDYANTNLPNLKCCVSDALRFKSQIEKMGFKTLKILFNSNCTLKNFQLSFDLIISHFPDKKIAQFIFYYAGHGVLCKRGKGWFALAGWSEKQKNSTGIRFSSLKRLAASIGAVQQLYVLDCCHSGKAIFEDTRGISTDKSLHSTSLYDILWAQKMLQKPAIWAITAVSGSQLSIESNGEGIFTKCLCDTLSNNITTVSELLTCLQKKVLRLSNNNMNSQGGRIILEHYDMECAGEFIFSRSTMKKEVENQNNSILPPKTLPTTPRTIQTIRTPSYVQSDPKSRRRSNVRLVKRRNDVF